MDRDSDAVTRARLRLGVFSDPEFDYQFVRVLATAVYGGAALAESLATAKRIVEGDPASWTAAWTDTAAGVARQASALQASGELVGARDAWLRAANYYRAAEYYSTPGQPEHEQTWQESRNCFRAAAALFDPPIEPIRVPFEGGSLPGYFMCPPAGQDSRDSTARRPTLIALTGFDGSGEEQYFYVGAAGMARGWNVLAFEGPGQAGYLHETGQPFRPDYEYPVAAVVDHALARPDVDPDRLAAVGFSWGGNFVLRARAYEPRLKAGIADSPIVSLFDFMTGMLPPPIRQLVTAPTDRLTPEALAPLREATQTPAMAQAEAVFTRRMGAPTIVGAFQAMRPFDVSDAIAGIHAPLLCLVCEGEGPGAVDQARQVAEAAPSGELYIFTDAQASVHTQLDNLQAMNSVIFDWLRRALGQ